MAQVIEIRLLERPGPVYHDSQYHGCHWLGDARKYGISSNAIDIVFKTIPALVKLLNGRRTIMI